MVKFDFQKPPSQVAQNLKNKGFKLSFSYDELSKQAHQRSFTVAKVTRADLLNDIHKQIVSAQEKGTNFKQFKKEIIPTLEKKGWWGKKEIINPKTGEIKKVNINSRRLKTIFDTNMTIAYNQQRYTEMMELPNSTFWMYRSALIETTRASHAKLHGTVLPRDDNFWQTNYPPNAFNCKCKVTAHSKEDLKKRNLKVYKGEIKSISSKEFSYNIGKTLKIGSISKIDLSNSLSSLLRVKTIRKKEYESLSEDELKAKFYKSLDVKEGDIFIDKINDPMIIDDSLFLSASKHSKIKKQDRHLYLDEIAKTIKDPHEIYLYFDEKNNRLLKKMFRYYKGEKQAKRAIQVAFEYLEDKTQGITAYFVKDTKQVEKRRIEKLIYQKGQE